MKKYAVSYINFFNNELTTEIVEAETIKEAVAKHSKISSDGHILEYMQNCKDLDEIQTKFFDTDCMVSVIAI